MRKRADLSYLLLLKVAEFDGLMSTRQALGAEFNRLGAVNTGESSDKAGGHSLHVCHKHAGAHPSRHRSAQQPVHLVNKPGTAVRRALSHPPNRLSPVRPLRKLHR